MENYKFKDIPISPGIAEKLILKLYNGGSFRRSDIINKVIKYHMDNGGKSNTAVDRKVKKALTNLKNQNLAENISIGYWTISNDKRRDLRDDDVEPDIDQDLLLDRHDGITFGIGESFVYVYYYPQYKFNTLGQEQEIWPCKIGVSDIDPLSRILAQSSTALPESPEIGLIIRTDDSSILEKCIHYVLHLKGRYLESSPGTEWFKTSPDEIMDIINWINQDILKKVLSNS